MAGAGVLRRAGRHHRRLSWTPDEAEGLHDRGRRSAPSGAAPGFADDLKSTLASDVHFGHGALDETATHTCFARRSAACRHSGRRHDWPPSMSPQMQQCTWPRPAAHTIRTGATPPTTLLAPSAPRWRSAMVAVRSARRHRRGHVRCSLARGQQALLRGAVLVAADPMQQAAWLAHTAPLARDIPAISQEQTVAALASPKLAASLTQREPGSANHSQRGCWPGVTSSVAGREARSRMAQCGRDGHGSEGCCCCGGDGRRRVERGGDSRPRCHTPHVMLRASCDAK